MPPASKRSRAAADLGSDDEQNLSLSDKLRSDIFKQIDRYTDAIKLESGSATGTAGVLELQSKVLALQQELIETKEELQKRNRNYFDTKGLNEEVIRDSMDPASSVGVFSNKEMSEIVPAVLKALQKYAEQGHSDLQTIPTTFCTQVNSRYWMCCGFGMKMMVRDGLDRINMTFPSRNNFRIIVYK